MSVLTKFNHMSQDSRSILTRHVIENVANYTYSSLATVCTSLVKIGHEDGIVLDIIKQNLLKRFTDVNIADLSEEIKPADIAQFLTAFIHFERYDAEILTVLEQVYVNIIDQAEGKETAAMLIHHSSWVQDILKYNFKGMSKNKRRKLKKKNKMLNRTEKIFKKYNHILTEKMLENLTDNIHEINLNALVKIQSNLCANNIEKNSTKRAIIDFLITGLRVFKIQEESDAELSLDEFKYLLGRYYFSAKTICFKKYQLQLLVETIYQVLGYSIFDLQDELSPLRNIETRQDQWEEELREEMILRPSVIEDVILNTNSI